jgi:hypothetical protein
MKAKCSNVRWADREEGSQLKHLASKLTNKAKIKQEERLRPRINGLSQSFKEEISYAELVRGDRGTLLSPPYEHPDMESP